MTDADHPPRTDVPVAPLAHAAPRMQQAARHGRLLIAMYGDDVMLEWEEDDNGNLTWVRVG